MAEESKPKWLNYVSASTIVFAVCATLSTFKGGGYSTRTVLYQLNTANEWAYYQSKDLKSYLHELQRDQLEMALKTPGLPQEVAAEYGAKIAAYGEKIKKYDAQKADIEKKAKSYEQEIKDAQAHSRDFGMAVIFLQIAILLASISALMKQIGMWYASLGVGTVGIVYFANGFFAFL
jgi:hypothetical protein